MAGGDLIPSESKYPNRTTPSRTFFRQASTQHIRYDIGTGILKATQRSVALRGKRRASHCNTPSHDPLLPSVFVPDRSRASSPCCVAYFQEESDP